MKRALAIALAFILISVGGIALTRSLRGNGAAAGKTQYKLVKAETATVKKSISATGTLQPWTVVDIKSKAGGRVDEMPVEVGSEVKKGQVLARIDPSDTLLNFSTAQADVDSARSRVTQNRYTYNLQLQQSRIAIQTAEANYRNAVASRNAAAARLRTAQNQAKSQPRQTETAIRQAQANYNNARKQRQQLDATQPQERAQAQAGVRQAQANSKNAQENLRRQEQLLAKGFVSQAAVDQAVANSEVAEATLASANERLRSLPSEQEAAREAADARVSQARAQLENARAQTDVLNRQNSATEAQAALAQASAQVAAARAALDQAIANQANNAIRQQDITSAQASAARAQATMVNAKNTLDQTVVRAPSDGVILKKYVEPGTIITSGLSLNSTGTSIVQIGDISKMYVNVTVDETDIANVDVGQPVDVTIEAYSGVPFEGKVSRVDPQAQVEQNVTTVNVRVEIDNSSPTFRLLKPGMNATCEFIVDRKENVVSVPTEAVRSDDQGSFVEIASGGKPAPTDDPKNPPDPDALVDVKTRRVAVEVGLEGNDSVEIKSGVKEGDTVVSQTIEPAPAAAGGAIGGGGFGGRPGGGGGRR